MTTHFAGEKNETHRGLVGFEPEPMGHLDDPGPTWRPGQARAGRRQGHTHSVPHWGLRQLRPALGQQISLIRWRRLWLLAPR